MFQLGLAQPHGLGTDCAHLFHIIPLVPKISTECRQQLQTLFQHYVSIKQTSVNTANIQYQLNVCIFSQFAFCAVMSQAVGEGYSMTNDTMTT